MAYDDHFYRKKYRKEFAEVQCGLTGSVSKAMAHRWYPEGPVTVTKVGIMHSVAGAGSEFLITFAKGASASNIATFMCSTTTAQWTRASNALTTVQNIGAGSYMSITANGTDDTSAIVCWVDYYNQMGAGHESKT